MLKKIDWDRQIGRRLRLHDLHVFLTVAQRGSMSKTAEQLGVSIPTVSEVIANLEHGLGVRLLDRSPKGVEPTRYGDALLKRTLNVFDELKQSIRDIEYLADPTTGEVRIACPLAIAFTVIPHVFERFVKKYPRVVLHFDEVTAVSSGRDFQDLRDRKYDLILGRGGRADEHAAAGLKIEFLFDDQLVIVAGAKSKWTSRRRKIDLAELGDESWIMQRPQTWNYRNLSEAFHARGLAHAEGQPSDTVDVGHYPFPCRRPVHHVHAAFGGVLLLAQSATRRSAGPAVAGLHRDVERPDAQSSGRAFHRVCTRFHATAARRRPYLPVTSNAK